MVSDMIWKDRFSFQAANIARECLQVCLIALECTHKVLNGFIACSNGLIHRRGCTVDQKCAHLASGSVGWLF